MFAWLSPQYSRALAEVGAGPGGVQRHVVGLAGDDVGLAGQLGDPEGVDDVAAGPAVHPVGQGRVAGLEAEVDAAPGRDVELVGGDDLGSAVGGRVDELPPPLLADHGDLDRVGGAGVLFEDEADGRHRDHGEDHRRDDGPEDLELEAAVDLLGPVAAAGPLAVPDRHEDGAADDEQPDEDRDAPDRVDEVVDLVGVGAVARRRCSCRWRVSRRRRRRWRRRLGAGPSGPGASCGSSCLRGASRSEVRGTGGRVGSPAAIYPRAIGVGQLVARIGPGQSPSRSSASGRRCQSRSTRTRVSRYTRVPSSASSSRRAALTAALRAAPPRPMTMPFCDSRSTRMSTRSRRTPGSPAGRSGSGLELLDGDGDGVRQLVAGHAQQLLADQLGGEEGLGLVGDHAARVVAGPGRAGGPRARQRGRRRRRRCGPSRARRRRSRRARRGAAASWATMTAGEATSVLLTTRMQGGPASWASVGDEAVAAADRGGGVHDQARRRRPRRSVGPGPLVGALAERACGLGGCPGCRGGRAGWWACRARRGPWCGWSGVGPR